MKITLTYFGPAREAIGCEQEELEVAERLTVGDLLGHLRSARPRLLPLLDSCRVALGTRYASVDEEIASGSEVALIPPVAGG